MKIGILTWYKELNHGAILQAYASQETLKNYGQVPYFLDYERNISNNLGFIKTTSKRLRRFINGDYRYSEDYAKFKKDKAVLFRKFIDEEIEEIHSLSETNSCVMVGSDMVFSLIQGYEPYMFGNQINANYIFSYAACSGGTPLELVSKLGVKEELVNGLERFDRIGCRDEETQRFVNSFLPNCTTTLNIDPVLLYGFEKEKQLWSNKNETSEYLLIYSYHGDMNKKVEIESIRRYANEHNLKVISIGYYHPWCDENVNGDPRDFFDYFLHANCIVTDTFHGTVFSIILEKKFCSIIRGNGFKLRHLLLNCGLITRIAEDGKTISSILDKSINYSDCNKWLGEQRRLSSDYIKDNIAAALRANDPDRGK